MSSVLATMAKFTYDLRYEDLDATTVQTCKRFILDSIGCAYGGSVTHDVRIMSDFYFDMSGKPEASVINAAQKLPMINACLLNSLMIRALDYNDIYWEQDPSHPSDLIPAALTPAECLHKTGRELITAVVLGYEWEMRLCEFAIPGIRERKWHHATLTQFAAPLTAGKILALSVEKLIQATGIAASHNFTPGAVTAGKLTMMKNTVDPMAVQSGLTGALLAQRGYQGPEHILEGKEGFIDSFGGTFDLSLLTQGLGENFRINRCSMKAFPTEALTHSPISAVLKIIKHEKLKKEDIAEVEVRTVARAADILSDPSKYDPKTRETADHSLPYCIAAAIVDVAVTPQSFSKEKLFNQGIRALLKKIKVIADPGYEKTFPALKRAGVGIHTHDHRSFQLEVDYPLGDYREPMDEQVFMAKFDAMVLPLISKEKRNRTVDTIENLERLEDVAELATLLAK
jgi:2-methylcitrate dehydratase